jgi:hypothetical protein
MGSLNQASQLQPIVNRAVISLYGKNAKNIIIHEAEKVPLFKKPKQYWQVDVLFNNDDYKYNVQFEIKITDGLVTKVKVVHRDPIAIDKK